jgi:hypothetical protein
VTLQERPAASFAVQLPVTLVRDGAADAADVGSGGREAVWVGAGATGGATIGSATFGVAGLGKLGLGAAGLLGVGSIGTLEPAGGKPLEAGGADGAVGGKGCDVTGGNVEVETRPIGAGVNVCWRGGGSAGTVAWRPMPLPNSPKRPLPSQAARPEVRISIVTR